MCCVDDCNVDTHANIFVWNISIFLLSSQNSLHYKLWTFDFVASPPPPFGLSHFFWDISFFSSFPNLEKSECDTAQSCLLIMPNRYSFIRNSPLVPIILHFPWLLCAHDCNVDTHANFISECVVGTVCVVSVYTCTAHWLWLYNALVFRGQWQWRHNQTKRRQEKIGYRMNYNVIEMRQISSRIIFLMSLKWDK